MKRKDMPSKRIGLARQRLATRGTATARLGDAKRGLGEEQHSDEMMRKGNVWSRDAWAKHGMALIRKGSAPNDNALNGNRKQ